MYITYKTAMQLYDLGFHSFWQEHPSRDMVFYKDGICFSLGGNLSDPLTDEEKQLISDSVCGFLTSFICNFGLSKTTLPTQYPLTKMVISLSALI